MENTWTMDEAKNDFTAIADAVYAGEPQVVTNRSHPDLVIITKTKFEQMKKLDEEENKKFVEFLLSGPKGDIFPDGYVPSNISPRDVEF